jgi:hypothetical protein
MDVRLPNGTVIKNVPEGTTKADLTAKLQANGFDVSTLKETSENVPEGRKEPPSTFDVLRSAPNKAIAGMADTLLNFPANTVNLGKGLIGMGAQAIGKEPPFQITHPENTVENFYRKQNAIADFNPADMTMGQRFGDVMAQGATGALMGPTRTIGQAGGNMLRSLVGTVPGQAVTEATGNPYLGAATSIAAPLAVGAMAQKTQAAANAAQTRNAVRDETVRAAQQEGFVTTPGSVNPSFGNVNLERLGGKQRVQQEMSYINHEATQRVVRRELGLPENTPITQEITKQIRKDEFARGYEPVRQIGTISSDQTLAAELSAIERKFAGTTQSFAAPVKDKIVAEIGRFKTPQFNSADAVDEIATLRKDARVNFKSDDTDKVKLAQTQTSIADALENQIERSLAAAGNPRAAEMLDQYRASRKRMAVSHSVEDAIQQGSGAVNAQEFVNQMKRKVPLSGDLKLVAEFANNFPHVNTPISKIGTPGSNAVFLGGSGIPGAAVGFLGGGGPGAVMGAAATMAAGSALRSGARNFLQSERGQGRAIPRYETNVRNALTNQQPAANALFYGTQALPFTNQ